MKMGTTQRNNWDALSMKEKAAMMKVAVQNGIYNLNDIRQAYNEYAEGGNIYDGTTESTQQMNTPYTPFLNSNVTPIQAAMRQLQADYADPEKYAAYWNATHPQTTNETPIVAQSDGTFRRETRNIPLEDASMPSKTALEFTPVVGDVMFAGDVADEARQGNYGTAATMAGLAAGIPFVGNKVGKVARKFIRKFRGKDVDFAQWTPEQWTKAQDEAIARGDMAEAQRLRDLHFEVNAPNTKISNTVYHGTDETFNQFDRNKIGTKTDYGVFGEGFYFSPTIGYARQYGDNVMPAYLNIENPYVGVDAGGILSSKYIPRDPEKAYQSAYEVMLRRGKSAEEASKIANKHKQNAIDGNRKAEEMRSKGYDGIFANTKQMNSNEHQFVAFNPEQIKSANAVTYDNNGVRIPLGERDNFSINDIRYIWPTAVLGGTAAASYVNQQALGGPLVQLANKYEDGGPYKPGTIYGRPTEEGLKTVSPEFDALLIGRVAANAAREAAGKLLNSGIEGTARQRAAITSRRFGREMGKRRDEVKGWSKTLVDDIKDGNYADVPLDLKGLTRNVWETGRYIKNTPERYVENTLPRFYRNVFRRTYNNTKPAIPMMFSGPENNE